MVPNTTGTPPSPKRPPLGRAGLPRWLGQLPYMCVLLGVAAGLAVVATGHFKKGSALVSAVVLFGAVARLVLPENQIGLLASRKRAIDVVILVGFAIAIAVVAYVVPGGKG
jgi:hypothetical protein